MVAKYAVNFLFISNYSSIVYGKLEIYPDLTLTRRSGFNLHLSPPPPEAIVTNVS